MDEMEGERGMVMEVEGARKLGRKEMLSCRKGGYWDVDLCIGVSGSGGVGSNVGVDVTDGAGSGGGVGSGCGDSDSAGKIGGN